MTSLWPQIDTTGASANVEFVSAYPNKALGFEDIVAAINGDVIANMLARCGWKVTREFYVNDAGLQADAFARALYSRMMAQRAGSDALDHVASSAFMDDLLAHLENGAFDPTPEMPEAHWLPQLHALAVKFALHRFRDQLDSFDIALDVFRFESALMADENVQRTLAKLYKNDAAYDVDQGQVMFAAAQFGDRQDRPLKGVDGGWTYFMGDVVYHHDKIERGFAGLVTVFRADHAAYQERILATIRALSGGQVTRGAIRVLDPIVRTVSPDQEAQLMAFYTPRQLRWLVLSHASGQPFVLAADVTLRDATQAILDRFDTVLNTQFTAQAPADVSNKAATVMQFAADRLEPHGLCDLAQELAGDPSDASKPVLRDVLGVLGL